MPLYTPTPLDSLAYNGLQINGSMDVSQTNLTSAITIPNVTTTYVVDGFYGIYSQGTIVMTGQQIAPPGSPAFGAAFPNCIQFKSTTGASLGSGDFALVAQKIEGNRIARLGFGNAVAQPITIGFWVYTTIAGTMCVALQNSAGNRGYVTNVIINNATTWEYKTVTIPGDTTGTWLSTTGVGIAIVFSFGCGSTNQGTANVWAASAPLGTSSTTNFFASNNNVICLTGVVVVPGASVPSSTRSPFIMRPFDQELNSCRRYYQKSFPQGTAVAQSAGVVGAITVKNPIALGDPSEYVQFIPPMRASPTVVTYNPSAANANWRDITAAADATVSVDPASTKSETGILIATSGTIATLGDILAIHYTADARL